MLQPASLLGLTWFFLERVTREKNFPLGERSKVGNLTRGTLREKKRKPLVLLGLTRFWVSRDQTS